jgi:multidrug efflux pump
MLGVTAFGIFFTPVFYSVIRKFTESKTAAATAIASEVDAGPVAKGPKVEVASDGHAAKSEMVPQAVH